MTSTETAKDLYQKCWISGVMGALGWDRETTEIRAKWIEIAESIMPKAIDSQVNTLPDLYLDGAVENCSFDTEDESAAQLVTLQIRFPLSARFHKTPGSTRRILDQLMSKAQTKGAVLRISPVEDLQTRNEFSRMEKDGTLRELLPEEGTW